MKRKEIIECCPACGQEIHMFLPEQHKLIPYCPYCGERNVMLCSECMELIGDCGRNNPNAFCHNFYTIGGK